MDSTDPYPQLSPRATEIVDQLVDIAHDEGSPGSGGIEWYTSDEQPPIEALDELQEAGICRRYRERESVVVEFTTEGWGRYV